MNEAKTMPQKTQTDTTGIDTARTSRHPKNDDKLHYMKFHPGFIDDIRTRLCAVLNLETHAKLPVYFRSPYAFPAAIGFDADMKKRYNIEEGSEAKKVLNTILGQYLGSLQYISAMCAIPKRYNLNMEPAGEVTNDDRAFYQVKLQRRVKIAKKRRERQNAGSPKISLHRKSITSPREGATPNDPGKSIQTKPE